MKNTTIQGMLVGAALALAAQLVGIGLAHAETDREDIVRSQTEAYSDLARGEAAGMRCELIQLEDGRVEAQCDEEASGELSSVCDRFAQTYSHADQDMAYEACMVIGLHTGAVR